MSLSRALALCVAFCIAPLAQAVDPANQSAPSGQSAKFDYKTALAFSQSVIGNKLSDHPLIDNAGNPTSLAAFRGKPLVLSLVYTSCYHICPMTTRQLSKVVDKARETLGDDGFSVAILGFDARNDTPDAMRHFATKQGIDDKNWNLLSIAPEKVEALTRDLGFVYFPSPSGFDHILQATIIDAGGEVYRQVYGEVIDTPLLVEPLLELVLGRPKTDQTLISDLVDKVRLFCTNYDPSRDAYFFDYSLFIGMVIGALILLSSIAFIVRELLRRRRIH